MANGMGTRQPFVLLDEPDGGARALTGPAQMFATHEPGEVATVLDAADAARRARGGTLAGHLAYEAGFALEPSLAGRAAERSGAAGPLAWFALFERDERLEPEAVPRWLAERGGASGAPALGPLDPQVSPGGHRAGFDRLAEAIRAGDIYQANLTLPLAGSWRGDPVALYALLRAAAQVTHGALLFDGSDWLLSLSPELFFETKGRAIGACPMKGTRPRGASPSEDAALRAELAGSEKDRAENLMIVDLMRNDLSRIAEAGSVAVEDPFAVEAYPAVHQMVSTVRARLVDGVGLPRAMRALFPCGSITGAPKIRAMELLDEVERDARGPYCGAIGLLDEDGDMRFNVAIRTLRLTADEHGGGRAVLGVGSAVVADSDAMGEWRETQVKAGFARAPAATGADLIETMRFAPDEGIALIELHLERMKASAAALGFAFDRHAARNRIQALCFDLERVSRVRLLASRSGAIALEAVDLDPPAGEAIDCIALPLPVDPGDWRLRHKTTDRGFYEAARDAALASNAYEALLVREDGAVTEGSRTNVFVERDGKLLTPPAALGLMPGVMRRHLLESGQAREERLRLDDLADGFLLGNAVRGLRRARLA